MVVWSKAGTEVRELSEGMQKLWAEWERKVLSLKGL